MTATSLWCLYFQLVLIALRDNVLMVVAQYVKLVTFGMMMAHAMFVLMLMTHLYAHNARLILVLASTVRTHACVSTIRCSMTLC